jgi:hypothetical protein
VSTLDKVVGWFVVREEDAAVPSPTAPEPKRPVTRIAAAGVHGHTETAFAEMYARAGIDATDQERVTRALVLLRELPPEAPIEVRRAIVAASMKAFDVPLDALRSTATAQLRALEAYAKTGAEHSAEIVSDAHERIARLEAQIAEIRGLIELQKQTHDELLRATETEQARIRALEDFFVG